MSDSKPRHVYEMFIRTTPEKLWTAITSPDFTKDYFYGFTGDVGLEEGVAGRAPVGRGQAPARGKDPGDRSPPKRLVTTFSAVHSEDSKKDRPSRVTWEIQPRGEVCRLTVHPRRFRRRDRDVQEHGPGWNPVLSGLKTLLETGKPLVIAPEG